MSTAAVAHSEYLVRYTRGSTYVGVGLDEVLERGEGVCQDYAHLAVGMCRSVGIPARFAMGLPLPYSPSPLSSGLHCSECHPMVSVT